MNGFQRIQKALKGEWPDRRPVMLHNFMMAAEEAGYSMKEFREDPKKAADAFIQSVEKNAFRPGSRGHRRREGPSEKRLSSS